MISGAAAELAAKWGFVPTEELVGGECSHVFADAERVLKVPYHGEELTTGFRAALRLSGTIGPNVYESDADTGISLMQRLKPGISLIQSELPDSERFRALSAHIPTLQKLDPTGCLPLRSYHPSDDPLCLRLHATSPPPVFLHGDLHQHNVLLHGAQWVVIDPKGLAGDPAYEAASYLRNDWEDAEGNHRAKLMRRLDWFHQAFGFDRWRMAAWETVNQRGCAEGAPSGFHALLEECLPALGGPG
ncbi:MAG: aminoglycoside phosphotransferase family protein [Fimbriimonas sp.]